MRVGRLLLVAGLILCGSAVGQDAVVRFTASHAEFSGMYQWQASSPGAWLATSAEPVPTPGEPILSFAEATVTAFEYRNGARTWVDGSPLAHADPQETVEDHAVPTARLRILELGPEASIRLAPGPETSGLLEVDGKAAMHPDTASAASWAPGYTSSFSLGHDRLAEFRQPPRDQLLVLTSEAQLTATGPLRMWLHDVDFETVTEDGSVTTFRGRGETHPAGLGPASAEARTWTDFVIQVDDAQARLTWNWPSSGAFFLPEATLTGNGMARFAEVEADEVTVLPTDPERPQLVVLEGRIEAAVAGKDADSMSWALIEAQGVASAPQAAGAAWAQPLVWLVALGALGASPVAWRAVSTRRTRPSPPVGPAPTEAATGAPDTGLEAYNHAIELVNQGRIDEALPGLERAVAERPAFLDGRYALGVALARADRMDEAMRHLDAAIRRDQAFLGLLLTDPETESFRHHPTIVAFVRREAQRFRRDDMAGYM